MFNHHHIYNVSAGCGLVYRRISIGFKSYLNTYPFKELHFILNESEEAVAHPEVKPIVFRANGLPSEPNRSEAMDLQSKRVTSEKLVKRGWPTKELCNKAESEYL